jgi:hypothetical protein
MELHVGFEVFLAVVMKCSTFWSVIFCYLLHPDSLLGLFFDRVGEGEMFLRNVGCLSTDYSALYPKKLYSVTFSPQANYTDRASDRRLSTKLVPTFAERGCLVVSATDPPGS